MNSSPAGPEVQRLHELYLELDKAGDPAARNFQIEPFSEQQVREGLPVLRKIESIDKFSRTFADLATHPNLVAVLKEILGPAQPDRRPHAPLPR